MAAINNRMDSRQLTGRNRFLSGSTTTERHSSASSRACSFL